MYGCPSLQSKRLTDEDVARISSLMPFAIGIGPIFSNRLLVVANEDGSGPERFRYFLSQKDDHER